MKKVMIAVLAIAMLFGFVACSNENGGAPVELRENGTAILKDGVDYLVGEKFNPNDFTFTAYTVNGEAVTVDSSIVSVKSAAYVSTAGEITVEFLGENGVSFFGKVTVYAPEKIAVDASASNVKKVYYTTEDSDYQKIDLTGVVVTATYKDADKVEKTKTVDVVNNELISGALSDWETANPKAEVTVTYQVGEADDGSADDDVATETGKGYTVDLKDNLVTKIELKATEDYGVVLGDKGAVALAYADVTEGKLADKAKGVYVEATYQNEETKILADDESGVTYAFGTQADQVKTAIANIATLAPTTDGSFTLYVKITGLNAIVGFDETVELPLKATTSEVTDIKVEVVTAGVEAADYRNKDDDFKALFTVTTMYGEVEGDEVKSADITVDPTDPDYSSLSVGSRQSVTVTAKVGDETFTKTVEFRLVEAKTAGDGGQ